MKVERRHSNGKVSSKDDWRGKISSYLEELNLRIQYGEAKVERLERRRGTSEADREYSSVYAYEQARLILMRHFPELKLSDHHEHSIMDTRKP